MARREGVRNWRLMARLATVGGAFRARWPVGLRAALTVGIPLLAGVVAGRPGWGAVASFGGLAGFYGPTAPRPHRIRLVAGVGIALAVVVPLGSLCASRAWLAVAFAGATAAVACIVFIAFQIPPPREYLVVLAALAGTGIPASLTGALRECGLVAAGAMLAAVITVTPTLGRRRAAPQARAMTESWAATATVLDAAGTPGAGQARGRALAQVVQTREVLDQAGVSPDDADWRSLAAVQTVLASALSVSIEARSPLDPRWAASVRRLVQASVVDSTRPDEMPDVGDADLPGLRWAIGQARRIIWEKAPAQEVPGTECRRGFGPLREALNPRAVVVPAAVRMGVVVAAGASLGHALGLGHAYWIGLTAAAALQASNVSFTVWRSAHRVAGTIAGVGLAGMVFVWHPPTGIVVAAAICAQFAAEVLMPVSYGLAVTFVTVIALAVYDLAASGAGFGAAIGARVLDTLIGAALAVFLRVVLWPRVTAAQLPILQAGTLRAVADAFSSRWLDAPRLGPARHRLQGELLNLRAISQDTLADHVIGSPAPADHVTPVIDELAVLALGIPFDRPRPLPPAATALVRHLENLAAILETGTATPQDGNPPVLPAYPRTQAAASLLGFVVSDRRHLVAAERTP